MSLSTSQTNVSCNGGSDGSIDLSVSGGSGSYTYSWDNGSTTQDLTGLSAGTYTVTVTDVVCSTTQNASVTITEPSALSVSIQSVGSATVCSGISVSLSMVNYASPANTYQWSDASGAISGATSSTYSATAAGSYTLTVTTPAGCSATSSAVSVSIITPSVPSGLSSSNLELTKGTMNWSAVSNTHHYDVRLRAQGSATWTTLMQYIYTTSKQKSNLTPSTTYEWQVRSACSSDSSSVSAWSSTQTFTTLTPCTAPLNPVTSGIGLSSATLDWDAVSGAWGYRVRYKKTTAPWSAWTYDTVTTNSYSLSGLPQATYYHWQVATMCAQSGVNNSGFTSYTTFTTISCNMSLSTSQTNVSCNGGSDGSIDLSASGGSGSYTYSWSTGATTQDLSSLSAGTYTVTVTDVVCSTTQSTSVTITEPQILNATYTKTNVSCNGFIDGSALVNITGGTTDYILSWDTLNYPLLGGINVFSTPIGVPAGVYPFGIIDDNGCTFTDTITITEPDSISVSQTTTNVSCNGLSDGSVILIISGGTPGYSEDWGTNNPNALSAGTYNYSITDTNSCNYNNVVTITEPIILSSTINATDLTSCLVSYSSMWHFLDALDTLPCIFLMKIPYYDSSNQEIHDCLFR